MSIRETPDEKSEPQSSSETSPQPVRPTQPGAILGLSGEISGSLSSEEHHTVSSSRWIDYDTHELLDLISAMEDERRWSRLREGVLWAVLIHLFLISAVTWIPTYVFKVPRVVDPFDVIKQRKDLTLDMPSDLLRKSQPKFEAKPLPRDKQLIDKKTMDEMKREAPPQPQQQPPQPQQQSQQLQAPEQPKQQPAPQQQQSQLQAPRPAAVPAKPNFAMGSQNPADQLRDAMRNSMRGHGEQNYNNLGGGRGELSRHPGAGTGGVQVLSDTQGVDFSSWLTRWHYITEHTWDPLIPDEVNPPILKSGVVAVRFKVLPNGQVTDMRLEGRSGDTALDRAAWGAITGSSYPGLPREFHGPYLELRAYFLYNAERR
jgi:TonB family protein